ncbi:MAG: hypothetical protein IH872_05145 [Chloroflexi bacterium]|nr:hypothetical protein [Chloroflexota bacterium]
MLKLNQATSIQIALSRRLGLALIAALLGAMLLAMFAGAASAQSSAVIGRGFTGVVKSVSITNGLLAVESKGILFQVGVDDATIISVPPDQDVGLDGLPVGLGFRIAGTVDAAITDANGIPFPEIRTAQKIIVIPEKATRSHKRTIAADKQGDDLIALDADGVKTELKGRGAGIEKGDAIIILVQKPGRGATKEKVRGLFKAKTVTDRLDRLSRSVTDDPIKASILAGLRDRRDDAQEKHLQRTAENAESGLKDFVLSRVRAMQEERAAGIKRRGVGADVSECARSIAGRRATSIRELNADQRRRVTDECLNKTRPAAVPAPTADRAPVVRITSPSSGTVVSVNDIVIVIAEAKDDEGVASVTFNVAGTDVATLSEAPYTVEVKVPPGVSPLVIKATARDADGNEGSDSITLRVARRAGDLGVKITSPTAATDRTATTRPSTVAGSSRAIAEGDTIAIRAEVTGTGVVTVVFTVNGVDQTPVSAPPYAIRYFVPFTSADAPPPLKITAVATDSSGGSVSDSVSVSVVRNVTVINVKIISPAANSRAAAGETIVIRAATDNDAAIAFVTFSVGGTETVIMTAPFTHTYVLPRRATSAAATSNIPPNVFVGKAMLNGVVAPDGTVVTAWIAGSNATTLIIKVTATANSGETDSASLTLPVSGAINAGEAIVKNGEFVVTAAQPSGQSFAGKTVTFTIGGKDARQTGTWQQGGATILDLTAD